jgi:hypothetical protein
MGTVVGVVVVGGGGAVLEGWPHPPSVIQEVASRVSARGFLPMVVLRTRKARRHYRVSRPTVQVIETKPDKPD